MNSLAPHIDTMSQATTRSEKPGEAHSSGRPLRVMISGGGSGGHVFPAIAIADAIREALPGTEFLFVGARDKMEMEKVPEAGYKIVGLWISGFHRKLTPRNLLFPLKLVSSLVNAWSIIRDFRPDVVVGVGGFASGPVLEVAVRNGIPTLIQEQNSYAGVTNKLLAGRVDKICVAYPNMDRFFPQVKVTLTGNPVRADLHALKAGRAEAAAHFGLDPGRPVILVFGGSLGASSINHAMEFNHPRWSGRPEVQILWQAGKLYYKEYEKGKTAALPQVKLLEFIDRMDLAYALADMVICRAGALTISELTLVGASALLVPSPNVAEDHQTSNAMALVQRDAAEILKDYQLDEHLAKKAFALLDDPDRRKEISRNIRELAKPDAAQAIAREIIELAKSRKPA